MNSTARNHYFNNQKLIYVLKTRKTLNNLDKEGAFPPFLRDLESFLVGESFSVEVTMSFVEADVGDCVVSVDVFLVSVVVVGVVVAVVSILVFAVSVVDLVIKSDVSVVSVAEVVDKVIALVVLVGVVFIVSVVDVVVNGDVWAVSVVVVVKAVGGTAVFCVVTLSAVIVTIVTSLLCVEEFSLAVDSSKSSNTEFV